MKIYVAARFYDKKKVKKIYNALEDHGHKIVGDWTWHKKYTPYSKHGEEVKKYAIEDINGIRSCDIFILLTSTEAGAGSSTELGAAITCRLETGKPTIYVIGEHIDENMFSFHLAIQLKKDIHQVLAEIKS